MPLVQIKRTYQGLSVFGNILKDPYNSMTLS